VDQSSQSKLHDYYFQRFAFYQNFNYEKQFNEDHYLKSSLTYYQSKLSRNGIEEPQRQQTGIFTALYSFKDKYNLQGVLNYNGGSSFSEAERFFLSPTIGASWVMSEEGFMENADFVDYLKLRGEYGMIGYESFLSPFRYRDRWNNNSSGTQFGPYQSNQWFGSDTDNQVYRTTPSRIGNPALTWEKRIEFNAGIDALMFDSKLSAEVNYYNQLRSGQISTVSNAIPYVAGISSWNPRLNYNNTRYTGVEVALQYTNKVGDLTYSFGGNAAFQDSKYEKYDQPNYRNEYQSRIGKPVDAIWGQTYLGKFTSDEEALEVPQLYDDVLHEGDLKYADKNGDGVVDDNDQSMIGRSAPKIYYALNFKVAYKNVDLYVMGTGHGMKDIYLNTQYYRTGWGNNRYSAFVRDNLGTGQYPKLTYYKVNNNFVSSDFWVVTGNFFKIQNAELGWNVPTKRLQWSGVRKFRIFARGANLLTLSKVKDIDPESKSSGQGATSTGDGEGARGLYPLYRTVTGGIKLTF